MEKNLLLIAGGGTLGLYTAGELLRLGHKVTVVCLEDHASDQERLVFYRGRATVEYLKKLLSQKRYDGIVNFLHYREAEDYRPYHALLSQNTDHLIFLSSYRVYADLEHPVRETSPQLLDVVKDPEFLEKEKYALSKSRCERFLNDNPYPKNWTIVRPVISFSDRRLDLVTTTGKDVWEAARNKAPVKLPLEAKNLTAGLDWAGNSGKLIANLLLKPETVGEAYTVTSAQGLTWKEVADLYTALLGVEVVWEKASFPRDAWHWYYDRAYDRAVDNTKVLKATGLARGDFKSIREGIEIELKKLGAL